jgi:NADPH:quinone reductase-like Zn-dependent oxidoreductase
VGTVVATGPRATRHAAGDRVVTAIHGGKHPNIGSAAEYCIAEDDLVFKIPQGISPEDAVTFGVGFLTASAVRDPGPQLASSG